MRTHISSFDYELDETAIAQTPTEPRDAARLLDATTPTISHRYVGNLPELIGPGDLIVINNTRVIHARLALEKPTGAKVEVFLLNPAKTDQTSDSSGGSGGGSTSAWEALVKPSKRVAPGTELVDAQGIKVLTVGENLGEGRRMVTPAGTYSDMYQIAKSCGNVPLPPYIHEELQNPERYQTVYSARPSSVAAPTAGLHLTESLLEACRSRQADIATVDLSVGLGTFRPIMTDDITQHHMHAETYNISDKTMEAIEKAERVIAVGTTTVRALESAFTYSKTRGSTELFITPGYQFKCVDALWTNFHQPKSSLLVLLAAFAGPRWREIYKEALAKHYRFLSFGDAMFVTRHDLLDNAKNPAHSASAPASSAATAPAETSSPAEQR